ncbi:protein NKG7-like [Sceloporus undulatus]|uniref:protein NKG7-like n=1 Tax=Sceloporus undulatus TaxID=8520 RepID=UPI001C4D0ABC|nr:protein NKG7-like [Sceloporus undulatus]
MLACRIFSVLLTSISLVLLLMALITDYWIVASDAISFMHSGLWKVCRDGNCFVPNITYDYIIATRAFLIMASLTALTAVIVLVASFMPYNCGVLDKPLNASVAAIIAGLFNLTALAVFTAESWQKNVNPKIQVTFQWSFYLGWAAFPMLLLAGIFSLVAHLCSLRSGYNV